jgi:hypothetical protein
VTRRAFLKTDPFTRSIIVTFPYNERGVEVMHTCGGSWDGGKRRWEIPERKVDLLVAEFEDAGYRVVLDHRLLPPVNPFLPLAQALPERLREPVYRALSEVLEASGDGALLRQLKKALRPARKKAS